jgi:hypothetical protein
MGLWMYYYRVDPPELESLKANPTISWEFITDELRMASREFSIEKSWDALSYLLETTYPNDECVNVIGGGTEIEGAITDGPSLRYFTPEEVKAFAAALLRVTSNELLAAYDPKRMNELHVYPGCWGKEIDFERRYLTGWFDALVGGFSVAAQRHQAVLSYLAL